MASQYATQMKPESLSNEFADSIALLITTPLETVKVRSKEEDSFKKLAKSLKSASLTESKLWKACYPLYYVAMVMGCFPAPVFESQDLHKAVLLTSTIVGAFIGCIFLRTIEYLSNFDGSIDEATVFKLAMPFYTLYTAISWIWCIRAALQLPTLAAHLSTLITIDSNYFGNSYQRVKKYCIVLVLAVVSTVTTNTAVLSLTVYGVIKFPWEPNIFISREPWTRPCYLLFAFPTASGMLANSILVVEMLLGYMALHNFNTGLTRGCLFEDGKAKYFRQEYQRIVNLVHFLDRKWSWFCFCADGVLIVLICVMLYLFGSASGRTGQNGVVLSYFFWLTYNFLVMLMVNLPPSWLNETSDKTLDILMRKINQRLDHLAVCRNHDGKIMTHQDEDLKHLYHQITNNRTCITAGNFFIINRTTLLTIGSAVLTYFIIIVQFSTPPEQNKEAILVWNTTNV